MARVGIFGGAFDPPHAGHLRAAIEAKEALGLDEVVFVPVGTPPHRDAATLSDGRVRLEMVRAAVRPWRWMKVSDVEVRRGGVSWTAETVRHLDAVYPEGTEFFLLVGTDWRGRMRTWKDYGYLRRRCRIVWLGRGGGGADLPMPVLGISSTLVRERVRQGRDISLLVPEAVVRIIRRRALYGGTRR